MASSTTACGTLCVASRTASPVVSKTPAGPHTRRSCCCDRKKCQHHAVPGTQQMRKDAEINPSAGEAAGPAPQSPSPSPSPQQTPADALLAESAPSPTPRPGAPGPLKSSNPTSPAADPHLTPAQVLLGMSGVLMPAQQSTVPVNAPAQPSSTTSTTSTASSGTPAATPDISSVHLQLGGKALVPHAAPLRKCHESQEHSCSLVAQCDMNCATCKMSTLGAASSSVAERQQGTPAVRVKT